MSVDAAARCRVCQAKRGAPSAKHMAPGMVVRLAALGTPYGWLESCAAQGGEHVG